MFIWGCTKECSWGCTRVAPVFALVDATLMHKYVQNGSSNGWPYAALEGVLDGGLNVGLEWVPYSNSLWKQLKMHKKVTKRMHLTFYLMMFAAKCEHASAVKVAPDGLSEGTPLRFIWGQN